jgi:hypothetical protein
MSASTLNNMSSRYRQSQQSVAKYGHKILREAEWQVSLAKRLVFLVSDLPGTTCEESFVEKCKILRQTCNQWHEMALDRRLTDEVTQLYIWHAETKKWSYDALLSDRPDTSEFPF